MVLKFECSIYVDNLISSFSFSPSLSLNTHTRPLQISSTLTPYIKALMQGMPPKCKLPLFEYGSEGVLGFYQAQLTPVVTYRDLQTDVFQSFKEIGNTVLFCLQLEKALVS